MHDIFISHASEDKYNFVRPLAEILANAGIDVWYDEFSLKPGDSLRQSIDRGLSHSRFGIVVLSPNFFGKGWTEWELNGLIQRHLAEGSKVIIPIWHEVTSREVSSYSPSLSDIVAIRSSIGPELVAKQIIARVSITKSSSHLRIALLRKREIQAMYKDRHNTQLGPAELRLILLSILSRYKHSRDSSLGWFWLKDASIQWCLEVLREVVLDPRAAGRWLALRVLGAQQCPEDLGLFRRLLNSRSKLVRREAVRAVGSYRQADDLSLLRKLASNKKDKDTRREAVRAIAAMRRDEDLTLLREAAGDRIPWAAEALGWHCLEKDRPLLKQLLYKDGYMVWLPAEKALAQYEVKKDPDQLLRTLHTQGSAEVNYNVVEALAALKRSQDLPLLRELARNKNSLVRQRAAMAIADHKLAYGSSSAARVIVPVK